MAASTEELRERRWTLQGELERVEAELRDRIVAALVAGQRPGTVARSVGYSREQVRAIARSHGLEPAPRGRPRKDT